MFFSPPARAISLGLRSTCIALAMTLFTATLSSFADDKTPPSTENLPTKVDLRPEFERYGLTQRSQGRRGTCSVFATVEAIEYELAKQTGKGERLSVEFANWAANEATGRRDDGDFFHNIHSGIDKHGVCPEEAMPYARRFRPDVAPSEDAKQKAQQFRDRVKIEFHWIRKWSKTPGMTDEDVQQIKAALAAGHCVSAGSYHSVLFVGYEEDASLPGGGRFFIADSNRRETEINFEAAKQRFTDLFWVSASVAAESDTTPTDAPAPN